MKHNKKLLTVMITITLFICIVVGGILVNASKKSDANKAIVANNKVEAADKAKVAQMEEEKASLAKAEEEKASLAKAEEEKARLAQIEEEKLRLAQIEEEQLKLEEIEKEEAKVVKIVANKVNVSQTAAEKVEAEKAAAKKVAAEKAATEKAETEKAETEKAAAEKAAAEKAAAEKIEAELEQINIINQAAADIVNIAIAALPAAENVVLDYEEIINAASTKYNNLTDTQKQMVSTENKTKLSKVLAKLAKLKDWTLQWSDEFNGSTLETSKWSYDLGNAIVNSDGTKVADGWGNNELQYYTNSNKNVALENGNLQIKAIKEKSPEQFGKTFDYTSGKIKTLGKFSMKYGKIDIKAKLPLGKGFWPAIWMLPANDVYGGWASSGEIDIVEGWGSKPQTVAGTLHYASTWPNNKYTGKEYNFPETTSVNEFHNYSLEWEPGEIRWYVDGVLYQTQNNWYTKGVNNEEKYSFPAPFDQDFYLILNLAVGGNFDGDPTVDTKFPSAMEIDYVRAYKLTGREYKTPVEPSVEVEPLPEGSKIATADGNLLSNGDFSQPIQDNPEGTIDFLDKWNFVHGSQFGGNGTQSIDTIDGNKYAKINVTSGGAQNYSVQLIQLTTLGKGRYYKVSFDAKAAANRTLNMKMGGGEEAGWSVYSDSYNFDLTDEFQHFEKVFQMASDSDIKSRLEFNLGLDTNAVWIGNARLEEVDAPIQNENDSKTPLSDGNRIYNGTFDKESIDRMAYWNFSVAGAQATASVAESTRELFVKINNGGTNSSAITLNQKGIQLGQKDVYELTFKAKAEAPKTIQVGLLSKDGTVSYLDEQTINLTTEMKEQKISFTMDKATDLEAQIIFKLGGDKNDVYLDDVSLIPTTEFIDYSLIDLYPLKNGDFSNGLESWSPYPNIGDGGNSTITEVNGEAKISVVAPGPNPYSVMLNQEKFKVTKGVEYLVAFDVRSTAVRNITAVIDNAAYDQYLSKTVEAKNGMTHYEYTVKMTKTDTVNLKFLLGNVDAKVPTSAHDIYIDNVVLEVKNAPFKKSPTLVQSVTDNKLTQPIDVTFTDDANWRNAITFVKINDTVISSDKYTVSAGKITLAPENFEAIGNYNIVVIAHGYADATCVQNIRANDNLIISNGTFDTNTTGWEVYAADGSDATVNSVGGEMIVNFPNYSGWQKWSTQIYQNTIRLETGKTYELKFDASSTVARDAWMEMSNMEAQTLALTPTNKTFTYEFTAANTILNGKLNFLLGTSNLDGALFTKNQSVLLDNVSISEKKGEVVTPEVPTSENEVVNGDFSGETIAPWTNWSDGAVTVDQVNGEAKIDLNGFGGDPWSVQFSQDGFKFEPNAKYTMSFKAKSSMARSFGMSVEGAGYFRYLDKLDNLTTDMNTYTYDFVVTKDETTKMVFLLGKTGNDVDGSVPCTINIDDVVITKAGSTTPDTPPTNDAVIVSQTDATVLGAENAINVVNGNLVDNDAIETGKSIQSKTASMMSFDFNIKVAAAGKYSVIFRSNCTPSGSDLSFSAGANKVTAAGGADAAFNDITREMDLKAGAQIVSITGTPGMASTLTIKSITLNPIEIYAAPIIIGELTAIPSGVLTTLEAENAINIKNAIVALNDTGEGGSSLKATANMSFDFNVDVEKAGEYQITYRTNCGPDGLDLFLRSNGILLKHAPAPSGGTWGDTVITVSLDAGAQVLNVSGISSENSTILINSIKLMPTGGGGSTGGGTSITNTEPTVLEAENATNVTGASVVNNDSTEGGSSLQSTAAGNPMSFNFNVSVETAGQYTITYRRKNSGIAGVYFELKNGVTIIDSIGVGPSDTWTDTTRTVTLKAGAQVLTVFAAPGESSILNINNITITPIK